MALAIVKTGLLADLIRVVFQVSTNFHFWRFYISKGRIANLYTILGHSGPLDILKVAIEGREPFALLQQEADYEATNQTRNEKGSQNCDHDLHRVCIFLSLKVNRLLLRSGILLQEEKSALLCRLNGCLVDSLVLHQTRLVEATHGHGLQGRLLHSFEDIFFNDSWGGGRALLLLLYLSYSGGRKILQCDRIY